MCATPQLAHIWALHVLSQLLREWEREVGEGEVVAAAFGHKTWPEATEQSKTFKRINAIYAATKWSTTKHTHTDTGAHIYGS